MTYKMFVTCFNEFRIYESIIFLDFLYNGQNFSIEIKNIAKTIYFHKKDTLQRLEKKTWNFSRKKIVGSEFVKTCHEHLIGHFHYLSIIVIVFSFFSDFLIKDLDFDRDWPWCVNYLWLSKYFFRNTYKLAMLF